MLPARACSIFRSAPLIAAILILTGAGSAHADEAVPGTDPLPIFGGGPVSTCGWPSTVFLENCSGTLIHPEIVVYAGHCGADRERVWFGEEIVDGTVEPGQGFSVDTEYCVVNPDLEPASEVGEFRANDYAFCKLAEPVLDVPIVPPLMGCETTLLLSGLPVTLVGYGNTDQETFGVKFEVQTQLHYIDDWGAAVIGGGGQSTCGGDSGGPAFMQMPDGTWRAFGIVSGPNVGNCGDPTWYATIYSAIPFIEKESGIDVSVCHHSHGEWNPSPACGGFPLDPADGTGKTWAEGCGPTQPSEPSATCGPAFNPAEDLVAPSSAIVEPLDRERFDTALGEQTIRLVVSADVSDEISGVSTVALSVNGSLIDDAVLLGPPWTWALKMPPGVWELRVVGTDWAGNEGQSDPVVIGVNEDPPPAPEPSTTSGGEAETSTTGATTGDVGTSGADATSFGSFGDDSSTSATPEQVDTDEGCGCRSAGGAGGPWSLLLFAGLLAARRRRATVTVASMLLLSACGDDDGLPVAGGSTSNGDETFTATLPSTSTPDDTTTSGPGTAGSTSATTTSGSSTGLQCEPGTADCVCTSELGCDPGLSCQLNTCVPCEAGTLNCPCVYDEGTPRGQCEDLLNCFGGLCVNPQPCPFVENGTCDEPEGTRACLEGTDFFDCCAVQDGVCEEESMGGPCPDGSDPTDCGTATGTTGGSTGSTGGSTGSTG